MPNLDRAAIDKQRQLNNLPPLTDDEFASLSGNGHSEEEKAALLKKQKDDDEAARIKAEQEKEKSNPKPNDKPTPDVPKVEMREPTEEEILAMIEKKSGRKVASWDDLKPKEAEVDEQAKKEEREADKWSWAYKNKIVKQKEHENFIADSKDAKNLVYRLRLQEALKEDPALDEKLFQEEFDEEFGLDQKPETRRHKNGQATLNRIANDVLKSTYGSIYSLDEKYSQHEQSQNQKREQESKIKEGAKAYKETLDKVRGDLKRIKVHVDKDEEYEIENLDDSINKVIEMMSDVDWASQQILKGYSYEQLKDTAFTVVLKDNFPFLANEIKKQALLKHAKGSKGIIALDPLAKDETELNDQWKVMKNLIDQNKPATVGAN